MTAAKAAAKTAAGPGKEPEAAHVAEIGRAPLWVFQKMAELAEKWGGEFDPKTGRLELPVLAGLRHGRLVAEVEALPKKGGSKVRLRVLESHYQLDRGSTFSLALAAIAALATLVLPFFPRFWILLPPALVIAIAAWLFIVSRLRTSSVEDFLGELRSLAEAPDSQADAAPAEEPPAGAGEP